MAVLVVLLLISITLSLSYSIMRWQGTAIKIQTNATLTAGARQAAITGLTVGLKKMHTADWAGVDTTLTGSLGSYEGYQVGFATGDPSLAVGDPDYGDYPYRVTLLSTGYAADPSDPSRTATHQARAMVRLVPRKLADEPGVLAEIRGHTVYQSTADVFEVRVPFRIEGPVRIQKRLELAEPSWRLPWSEEARVRYLADLEAIRQAGLGDWRPFSGPLKLPYDRQDDGLVSFLNDSMDISTSDVPAGSAGDWDFPQEYSTYQIYPGGKVYSVQLLSASQRDVTLEPDVHTNPLGIYYCPSNLSLYDNVKITGTLLTGRSGDNDLEIHGRNVHLQPLDLPPLVGSDVPVQLPVAMLGDDLRIRTYAEASIAGLIVVYDEFKIEEDSQGTPIELMVAASDSGRRLDEFLQSRLSDYFPQQLDRIILAGCVQVDGAVAEPADLLQSGQQVHVFPRILLSKVMAANIKITGRSEWFRSLVWWYAAYGEFLDQEGDATGTSLFPLWLGWVYGLNPEPNFGIRPDPTAPRYHWQNQHDPIYVPHPDDATPLDPNNPGLRWDLLEWTDNP